MDCCLLSSEEVGRLLHYDLLPNHDEHTHLDPKEAIKQIQDGSLELVQGPQDKYYVTRAKMYFIRALPSGGTNMKVIQRVVSNQLLELKPLW